MELTDKDIQELKVAHKQEFNEELSDDQAREMARRLLLFLDLLRRHPAGKPPRRNTDQPTHPTAAERPSVRPTFPAERDTK